MLVQLEDDSLMSTNDDNMRSSYVEYTMVIIKCKQWMVGSIVEATRPKEIKIPTNKKLSHDKLLIDCRLNVAYISRNQLNVCRIIS